MSRFTKRKIWRRKSKPDLRPLECRERRTPSHKFSPWHRSTCPLPEIHDLLARPIKTVLIEGENGFGTQFRKLQS